MAQIRRRYPAAPIVGVAGVIINQKRALLIKRGAEPAKGIWSIPGGVVETGELLSQALIREIREETGLTVESGPLVEIAERIQRDENSRIEYHFVVMDYLCFSEESAARAGDDAADIMWVEEADLGKAGMGDYTLSVVQKAFGMARELGRL